MRARPAASPRPTAGLHFTEAMLERLRALGVQICFVTLHVGAGTFAPVKADFLTDHRMHEERYEISEETARVIAAGKHQGARIIAVGTTTLRVLESVAGKNSGRIVPGRGVTDIFIYPPYDFKMVDALLTNFHLPRSTLLMLVSAFAAPGEDGRAGLHFAGLPRSGRAAIPLLQLRRCHAAAVKRRQPELAYCGEASDTDNR